MILKVGFLVGASLAAFAVAQITSNSARNRKSSKDISENCDFGFQERDNEEEENEKKAMVQAENRKGYEAFELEFLSTVVEEMEQRVMSQETELLDLYSLKQQRICSAQLQEQWEAKTVKIDMLNAMKNALTAECMTLQEYINNNLNAKKELEIAKDRIKEIEATIKKDDTETKEQLKVLKEHVLGLNKKGISIINNNISEKKLQAMKDVELEVAARKRKNRELQLETRELAIKLVAAEARVAALSKMTEENVKADVKKEISSLTHANEHSLEQVERLQKNRFDMVEELVYQRWLNACLRFEIQDHHTPRERKLKHDLMKKKLSFDSQVRPKRASLDSISSRASSIGSDESSSTSMGTTPSYFSDQKSAPKKFSLIRSIKRWGKAGRTSKSKEDMSGNVDCSVSRGVIRRFSMSDVPSNPSILRNKIKQDFTESPEIPTRRGRRVSFSDSVKLKMPSSSDAPKFGASEDVIETSWEVESERVELEILASVADVIEAKDSGRLWQDGIGDDKGEIEMVSNGEIGQTEDQYPRMVVEELGKAQSNIEDQNLHTLHVVILWFLILLVLFIVLLFR